MAKHKWKRSNSGLMVCESCGCKIISKIMPSKRAVYSVFIGEYFIDKDGNEILLAGGARMPPCEPRDRGE